MTKLHYLTVQDVLWINQELNRKAEKFDFALLEEAVFYQYALGSNSGLSKQAARLLSGFMRVKPFPSGNEPTALVACAAFLRLNGKSLKVDKDGVNSFLNAAKGSAFALDSYLEDAPAGEHLDAKAAMNVALLQYGDAVINSAA